jgi:hypothetical protein
MHRTLRRSAAALWLAGALVAGPATAQVQLEGFWASDFEPPAPVPSLLATLPKDAVVIDDTGVPEFPRGDFGGLVLTPAAKAHAENWEPAQDLTIQRACMVQSIVYALQGPFPFEILQTDDVIVFKYEYFDQIRTIFMDGRAHPAADAPRSKMGFSTGRWDGNDLVVETSHIMAGTITNNGLDHSDDLRMVERYRLTGDGKLAATQWFSDPAVIETDGARYITWTKRAGQHVFPYDCDPSFALEYQQQQGAAPAE